MSKKLDLYLANLAVNYVKLHNLHWNVVGRGFKQVHEYLEEMYDETTESFDEVAEYQKMVGEFPKASLKDYMEIATIKELESKDYAIEDALKIAVDDLKLMRDLATEIRNEADEKGEFTLVALMEGEVEAQHKHIWFIESMLK
ncbi:MAG TPA: DNA starvation/stationary phase protection protein [Chloroflexi bacterium]|jgi:starvation-inducible DNA-binding protein|nr:DNA starvation/stationary phase protection protein [Anaerolineaceae bacterium]HHX09221.1 DNA starvation/stationary phase protection protein [Chloroflexota bacterium]